MTDSLDIAEVVRRTKLSSRTLRFYETRGLVKPMRTASGRRFFGPAELSRLHQITILKAAGLSLSQMAQLFSGEHMDLVQMLNAQQSILADSKAQIEQAQAIIQFALSRIDRGDPVDTVTLCALIESGTRTMKQEPKEWREVTSRYFNAEERMQWAESHAKMGDDFDYSDYDAKWRDLGGRIKSALPLSPNSDEARAFVREWFALLKPFAETATPAMWNATIAMYDDMERWPDHSGSKADPGFDIEVWNFMKQASAAAFAKGELQPFAATISKGDDQ